MKSASEEMIRKKSARKAQNLKSTKVAANSNGTSSRATDTTAKEARKNEAPAASPYQCNEPEVDSNDRSKVRLAEKANRGSLLFCAPTFSPPPKPCPLARQGPPQCSQETTFALCEKQLELGSLSALSTETVCKKTFVQDFEAPSNEVYSCTKKESLADSENPDIIGSTVPVKPILKCENSSKLYSLSSIANQLVTQEGQGLILSVVFNISFCLIKQFYLIKEKWETTSKMGEHNCSSIRKMYRYVNLELQITLCVNKNFYPNTILLAIIIFSS